MQITNHAHHHCKKKLTIINSYLRIIINKSNRIQMTPLNLESGLMATSLSGSTLLFLNLWLAFFLPTLAYCGLNAVFFTRKQIVHSLAIAAALGLVPAALGLGLCLFLRSYTDCPSFMAIPLMATVTALILCLMSWELVESVFKSPWARILCIACVCALFCFAAWPGFIGDTILLAIYALFSIRDLLKNCSRPKTLIYTDEQTPMIKKRLNPEFRFREKPNIYLFFLESTHSPKAVREIYNSSIDDLADFLKKNGFKVYEDAHSNADWTFDVRTQVFEMEYKKKFVSSYDKMDSLPPGLEIFVGNGYKINIFDSAPYVFGIYENIAAYACFKASLPAKVKKNFQYAGPLFAQSAFYRLWTGGMNPGELPETLDLFHASYENRDRVQANAFQLIRNMPKNESFFNIFYFGQPHARYYNNNWKCSPDEWKKEYVERFEDLKSRIPKYVSFIGKHDPEAVIIIMGDHGAHSLDYLWYWNETPEIGFAKSGLDRERLFLDLFSSLLAVKWPHNQEPDGFKPYHVSLLLNLVIALTGNPDLARFRQPDLSILSHKFEHLYVCARDGKPLPSLIPFKEYPLENNEAALREHLHTSGDNAAHAVR